MKLNDRIKLCREKLGLSQEEVAKYVGVSQPSYFKLEKGTVIHPKYLDKLAEVFQTTPEYLMYGIGNPPDYIDDEDSESPTHRVSQPSSGKIPLLTWGLVAEWSKTFDLQKILTSEDTKRLIKFISVTNRKSHKEYALKIVGDSMTAQIPGKRSFLDGTIIIVDPTLEHQNGDFVIAIVPNAKEAVFKQYVIDGAQEYLRPLNPQYNMTKITEDIEICGVVTASLDILQIND